MSDMTGFEQAVDQVIEDSERLHKVVNGTGSETVIVEDGSEIPTVRKALIDNLYFKTPPLPWVVGSYATVYNQLYAYNGTTGVQWWYAPGATAALPVALPTNPANNTNWRVYTDSSTIAGNYAPINSPIFTGNPQAPTPATSSNGTTIATTAFVNSAIAVAIASLATGSATYNNITVTGLATINNLTVNGTANFAGPVNADNSTGRFQNLVLTKQASTFTFVYVDTNNPTWIRSQATPYTMQTHRFDSDIIVNGTTSADNTTMSLTGVGNNIFDYVYIKGNSEKDVAEPRLTVSGTTQLENLRVTGVISGISLSVDGLDISPNSITTTEGAIIGGDLEVGGNVSFNALTVTTLGVDAELTVTGLSHLNGGFDTGANNGVVGGNLTVNGNTTLNGGLTIDSLTLGNELTVAGISNLNGGFNTGPAGNGQIAGSLVVGGNIRCVGLVATGRSELADVDVSGTLTVEQGIDATGDVTIDGNLSTTGTISAVGDVNLNTDGLSTTSVHNLTISGTVTGLSVDLTGQNINVASLTATSSIITDSLSVNGSADLTNVSVGFLEMEAEEVDSSTASWTPSGEANIYTVVVDDDLTIGAWPEVTAVEKPNAFSAMIYLLQDATGHTVTLDPSYGLLGTTPISTDANSVTILQLTYCGLGDIVDVIVAVRP